MLLANDEEDDKNVDSVLVFLFSKGLFSFGQVRGRSTEEFQSEVQRSSAGELEDEGQLDGALPGQR